MHILEIIFKSSKASFAIFWFCVGFVFLFNTVYYLNIGFYSQDKIIASESAGYLLIVFYVVIYLFVFLFVLNLVIYSVFDTSKYDKFIKLIAKLAVYLFAMLLIGNISLFIGTIFNTPIQRFLISLIPNLYVILVFWSILRKEKNERH